MLGRAGDEVLLMLLSKAGDDVRLMLLMPVEVKVGGELRESRDSANDDE